MNKKNRQGLIFDVSEETRITIFIEQDIEHDDLIKAREEQYEFYYYAEDGLNIMVLSWQGDNPGEVHRFTTDQIHHRVVL